MNKQIAIVSDFTLQGSGYLNISVPLSIGLANSGYTVFAVGLGYRGDEHNFNFSIIPCRSFSDSYAMVNNLHTMLKLDALIVALDIPRQEEFSKMCKQIGLKMIAITPLENPPLTPSWENLLEQIDRVFFISELGKQEAIKSGLEKAEHLYVGMDTNAWRQRTTEEYREGRKVLGIKDDTIVIMTVADNQERKNLSKAMEIVSKVKATGRKVKYILVTREFSEVGWKLRDLAIQYKISSDLMIFERGIPFKELFSLYAISDVFLLTSKAEGLNMAVLESMSVGVPVVATACGSLPELLAEGRGYLMETEYTHIDPWGNSRRDFPLAESGVQHILDIVSGTPTAPTKARLYMETRTWEYPIKQIQKAIEELNNEK